MASRPEICLSNAIATVSAGLKWPYEILPNNTIATQVDSAIASGAGDLEKVSVVFDVLSVIVRDCKINANTTKIVPMPSAIDFVKSW
mmetsp:Transcript_2520/g.2634  ORF Transcript_2520/g.2634 Transcript_2520/m.2634 type:complete len:87 (-) Transcript_2520:83-343(-)